MTARDNGDWAYDPAPAAGQQQKRPGTAADRDYRRSFDKAKSAAAPLRILSPEEWDGKPIPATRWIVRPMIPALAVCSLGGHGETGKSLLGLQLGVARALGRDWLGFPTTAGKTLIVACEDPAEQIHVRLAGILKHFGASFADLGDRLRIVDRNDLLNGMMEWENRWSPGEETALFSQVMNLAIDLGADLIVIDSRYDVFGGEQNDTPQVHAFMGAMRTLATEIDGSVLLLSHPSRAGLETGDGESGSVAWHNKVRSRLYLRQADPEKDGDADRVLEHLKSNWGPKAEPLALRWADGAFAADRPATGILASIEQGAAETAFLAALDKLTEQNRDVADRKSSGRYAPREMLSMEIMRGFKLQDVERAMRRLFDAGVIENVSYGMPSRGLKRIARRTAGGPK